MALDPRLLEIIVCPEDHGELSLGAAGPEGSGSQVTLTCQRCGLVYPVVDDIPVLLVDEATRG